MQYCNEGNGKEAAMKQMYRWVEWWLLLQNVYANCNESRDVKSDIRKHWYQSLGDTRT